MTAAAVLTAVAILLFFAGYRRFRHPPGGLARFTPYLDFVVAGLALFCAFAEYYRRSADSSRQDPLTFGERIAFRAIGVPIILAGLIFLGFAGYFGWLARTSAPYGNATAIAGSAVLGALFTFGGTVVCRWSNDRAGHESRRS